MDDLPADRLNDRDIWQTVLRTAVDPIIIIDQDGIISHVNEAAEHLFGHRAEAMVGRNVSILMPEPHRSAHDGYITRYLTTGQATIIGIGREIEAERADGTIFPVSLAVSEIKLGGRSWFTGIVHDLTKRRQVEAELRAATEGLEQRVDERTAQLEASMIELARSNRDLEQFAYIASHDLQAPLRNVRQGLELLDEHLQESLGVSFDDEAAELRNLTVAAVLRMEEMIQGLLSYSRLERGGVSLGDPIDLRVLAEEVLDQMRPELTKVGAQVEIGALPTVNGDQIQLRQLVQNLVENAYKYRDPDRPLHLAIEAKPVVGTAPEPSDDTGRTTWQVSIGDNGIGIEPQQRERVFELFRRAHAGYEGVGLGLAICQRIVERHGGDIWVEDGLGGGSIFHFTIPDHTDGGNAREGTGSEQARATRPMGAGGPAPRTEGER